MFFTGPTREAEWDKQKRIDKGKKCQTQPGWGIRHGAPVAWSNTPSSKCGRVLTDTACCESNQTDGCKKPASMDILSGGFKHFLNIHPYLGKIPILTHIFRMGWLNHQLVLGFSLSKQMNILGLVDHFCSQSHGAKKTVFVNVGKLHSLPVFGSNILSIEYCQQRSCIHTDLMTSKGCFLDWFPKRPTKIQHFLVFFVTSYLRTTVLAVRQLAVPASTVEEFHEEEDMKRLPASGCFGIPAKTSLLWGYNALEFIAIPQAFK